MSCDATRWKVAKSEGVRWLELLRLEEGNPHHIGAPMPGVVACVAAKVGESVRGGDILLTR